MSVVVLNKIRVANLIRGQFKLKRPNHEPTMFSLDELRSILEQINSELEKVSHGAQKTGG